MLRQNLPRALIVFLAAGGMILMQAGNGNRGGGEAPAPAAAPSRAPAPAAAQAGPPPFVGPPAPAPTPPIRPLPIPDTAVRQALADAESLPPGHCQYVRYVWDQAADSRSLKTTSLAWGYLSRGSVVVRPTPIPGTGLVRVDLRHYAPRREDLREVIAAWEELAFDPFFSLLLTKDTLRFAARRLRERWPRREDKGARGQGGKGTGGQGDKGKEAPPASSFAKKRRRSVPLSPGPRVPLSSADVPLSSDDVIRLDSEAVDPGAFLRLQRLLGTTAPVVEHRYFKRRALTTIKDNKVFKVVFGGLYYEFRGIKKAKDVLGKDTRATDLDLFFESLGIGNIKGGLTADKLFDRLRSDQALITVRSQITGKPRDVLAFQTPAGRDGSSWGAITGDVKDGSIDLGDRSFANLLVPRREAREAIFPGPTGFHVFTLFDGKGALQDAVPDDVAQDRTIPAPHTQRFGAGLECIVCHNLQGKDGWQPLHNDAPALLRDVDAFDDLGGGKRRFRAEVVDRLAKYTANFDKQLRRARDDLAEATLKATGGWAESPDQTDVCRLAAQRLYDERKSYDWDLVTPQVALRELGLEVAEGQAREVLRAILPPDLRAFDGEIVPEDPRIALLRAGIGIPRSDWSLAYAFAAERARRNPVYRKLRGE